jgi:hypothetical protein
MSATSRSAMSSQTSRSSMSRYSTSSSLTAATTEEGRLEQLRYFEKVRMKCADIAPEILRGTTELPKYEKLRKFARLKTLLKNRTRLYDPEMIEETMKLITDVDRSETIRMDGNISTNIYNRLIESRGFDLYARLRNKVILEQQQALRLDEGVDLEDEIQVPAVFDKKKEMLKQLATTTPAWKIDKIEPYNAPVGFAPNPVVHPHSLGNENYFSYDGDWKHGKMEGSGMYAFSDGLKYEGEFKANWPEGQGKAVYHGGEAMYEGGWMKGRFQGTGEMKCHGGSHYQGGFVLGRRAGKGVLKYGVGLVYDGEFRDGKPHGRGYMTSELTGYAFEGTFVNGRIEGSGVLITPAPDYQRIVRLWEKKKKPQEQEGKAAAAATAVDTGGSTVEGKEEEEEEEDDDDGTPDGFSLPGVVK